MLWHSNLNSAASFIKAVRKDPDFVFVARKGSNQCLTVSGAIECDPNMVVIGLSSDWRVHVRNEGRQIRATSIRVAKRRK